MQYFEGGKSFNINGLKMCLTDPPCDSKNYSSSSSSSWNDNLLLLTFDCFFADFFLSFSDGCESDGVLAFFDLNTIR